MTLFTVIYFRFDWIFGFLIYNEYRIGVYIDESRLVNVNF